jgi:uncharacterized RDD family membrane protein YckC
MMDAMVFIVAFLLILTKAMDALSTARRIRYIGQEANPLARRLMRRIGVGPAIGLVFLLACGIVSLSVFLLYKSFDRTWYKLLFILAGGLIAFVQAAVAESNHRGRTNAVSRWLLKVMGKWQ